MSLWEGKQCYLFSSWGGLAVRPSNDQSAIRCNARGIVEALALVEVQDLSGLHMHQEAPESYLCPLVERLSKSFADVAAQALEAFLRCELLPRDGRKR